MADRPPFDLKRAVFWLVAAGVGVHYIVVLSCVGFCVYYGKEIVEGKYRCDPNNRCLGILSAPFDFVGGLIPKN
jgi:hypothetical protein